MNEIAGCGGHEGQCLPLLMSIRFLCGQIEPKPIQMSDEGDHVGTVQYNLTESSWIEVSSLPHWGLRRKQHAPNDAYILCDGLQRIMDVAQLPETETNQSHDKPQRYGTERPQTSFTLSGVS